MFKFKFKPQKTTDRDIIKHSIITALLEVVYVLLVATFFTVGSAVFPMTANPIVSIMAFLLLFVLSAGISGVLILGYPVYYVSQNKYREALLALGATMLTLFIIFAVLLVGAALTIKI